MLSVPTNVQFLDNVHTKKPIYIFEIIFADGGHKPEGENDLYFGSAEIGSFTNFNFPDRYFPLLDPLSISAVSQKLDPMNGVSTIGSMSFSLIDEGGVVADIIYAALTPGSGGSPHKAYGLRRQRVELYVLYEGQDWTVDRVKLRTLAVDDLVYNHEKARIDIKCSDAQRSLRNTIFIAKTDIITADVVAASTTITVADATKFRIVTQPISGILKSAAFVKIASEIIECSAVNTTTNVLTIAARGALGTTQADHTLAAASGDVAISEVVHIEGNPTEILLRTMLSGSSSAGNTSGSLPSYFPISPGPVFYSVTHTDTITISGAPTTLTIRFSPSSIIVLNSYFRIKDAGGNVMWDLNSPIFSVDLSQFGEIVLTPTVAGDITIESQFNALSGGTSGYAVSSIGLALAKYNVYPAHWALALDETKDVDVASIEAVMGAVTGFDAADSTVGMQWRWSFDKGIDGKKFLEQQILRILGLFTFIDGNGRMSIREYADVADVSSSSIPSERSITATDVVQWGALAYHFPDLANIMVIDYDEAIPLSGKLDKTAMFVDGNSISTWGKGKTLRMKANGLYPRTGNTTALYNRFLATMIRLSSPPLKIALTLLSKWGRLQVGDVVAVTLPIRDLLRSGDLDRVFQVDSTSIDIKTGLVKVALSAQPSAVNRDSVISTYTQNVLRTVDVAYSAGTTAITTNNLASATYTNLTIGAIDTETEYYHIGNLTINGILTVNGSVKLFVAGTLTFGAGATIDGAGKGQAAQLNVHWAGGSPSYLWGENNGRSGFIGTGGSGIGIGDYSGGAWVSGVIGTPVYQSAPLLQLTAGTVDANKKWTSFAGLFKQPLWGSAGGTGAGYVPLVPAGNSTGYIGGNGGAGLLILCRGFDFPSTTTGAIDMSGSPSSNGGGGGGGTFGVYIERQAVFTNVFSPAIVKTGGGIASYVNVSGQSSSRAPTNGSGGASMRGLF